MSIASGDEFIFSGTVEPYVANTPIITALINGNLDTVATILQQGVNITFEMLNSLSTPYLIQLLSLVLDYDRIMLTDDEYSQLLRGNAVLQDLLDLVRY